MFCEHVSSDQRGYTRKERDVLYNTFYKPAAPAQVQKTEVVFCEHVQLDKRDCTHKKRDVLRTHSTNQQTLHDAYTVITFLITSQITSFRHVSSYRKARFIISEGMFHHIGRHVSSDWKACFIRLEDMFQHIGRLALTHSLSMPT
jgi:hypothetical protein